MEVDNFLKLAFKVGEEAGRNISDSLQSFHGSDPIWTSADQYKTEVDDANDRLARKAVREVFPDHNIWSEEGEFLNQKSDFTWYVDGVDGTYNLIWLFADHVSFCMSLYYQGRPIVGITNAALRREFYYASAERGAFLNEKSIHTSDVTDLRKISICANSGKHDTDRLPPIIDKLTRAGVPGFLGTNCASVPLCQVATGVIPAYIGTSLEKEDMAAGAIINLEAGNRVTNLQGEEWSIERDEGILVANPDLHPRILEVILG